jgi:ABC-2 type transport system ATP-binding protein
MGMKQRLGIAAALLGDPELLILDEPTNGLDPSGIHEMRALVRGLSSPDLTVLLSSHLLAEVEEICDWITMIDRGCRLYQGPLTDLLARNSELVVRPATATDLVALTGIINVMGHSARIADAQVLVGGDGDLDRLAAEVNRAAFEHGIDLVEIHPVAERLERTYLELVQGGGS